MADAPMGFESEIERLVVVLRDSAHRITANRSLRDTEVLLPRLVDAAVRLVPGAHAAGISQTENGLSRASHGSSRDVALLDAAQSELLEGPCISACDDPPAGGVVLIGDLAGVDADRWPNFAPLAVAAGYRSIMSIALSTRGPVRTALNVYGREAHSFGPPARAIAAVFGLQAVALLDGAENAAHLGLAMESRELIGRASGILMERHGIDETAAFEVLSTRSQDTNVKLVDVARTLNHETQRRRQGPA